MKGVNRILAALLTLLGFAGCETEETRVEYGVPNADFIVNGTVVNSATGSPVKGIRISFIKPEHRELMDDDMQATLDKYMTDTTETDGSFHIMNNTFPDLSTPTPVYTQDLDGTENGGFFGTDSTMVDFSKAEHSGTPGRWYEGIYTVTTKAELTEKESNE
jgi:putative lipoprotein (rSAM/lipoprotein system)